MKLTTTILILFVCFGCKESPMFNPSVRTVADTLCRINPTDFKINGNETSTNLPYSIGFIYRTYSTLVSVQILTSNDSLAGVIKLNLLNHGIEFQDNYDDDLRYFRMH